VRRGGRVHAGHDRAAVRRVPVHRVALRPGRARGHLPDSPRTGSPPRGALSGRAGPGSP
jgi:hypothetical protein